MLPSVTSEVVRRHAPKIFNGIGVYQALAVSRVQTPHTDSYPKERFKGIPKTPFLAPTFLQDGCLRALCVFYGGQL